MTVMTTHDYWQTHSQKVNCHNLATLDRVGLRQGSPSTSGSVIPSGASK
jgi:hypothetical protein